MCLYNPKFEFEIKQQKVYYLIADWRCNKVTGDRSNKELNLLLEKFKNGDQHAFDEIYKRCFGHIAFVCSKLCDNKEDVEEIVQDTFMTVFNKAKELRGDTFLALLRKIATRRCYDKHKSKKSQTEYIMYSDEVGRTEITELDEGFLPEKYLQNKENQSELLQVINGLPPTQRKMIYLYYYAGINTEEIARLNNCPSGNVRKTLHKARSTIKSRIGVGAAHAKVPLAAVLSMEAEVFVAGYTTAKVVGTVGGAVGATVTAANVFTIAACVVAAGAISAAVYLTLLPNIEEYEVSEPTVAVIAPVQETVPYVTQGPEEPVEEIEEELPYIPSEPEYEYEYEVYEHSPAYEAPEPPEYTGQATIPEVYTPEEEPPPLVYEPEEPPPQEEPPQAMPDEAEPYEPEPYEPEIYEPYEPELYEPEPIDRTVEILEALTNSATHEDVNRIVSYYGFSLAAQMRISTEEWVWFYVLDDGSGDILVGIAAYEEPGPYDSQWRMKFEHFDNGQRPIDRMDLFRWFEE